MGPTLEEESVQRSDKNLSKLNAANGIDPKGSTDEFFFEPPSFSIKRNLELRTVATIIPRFKFFIPSSNESSSDNPPHASPPPG
ncbi:hypothetical protein Tco_0400555 [Tanacetum coccineum]